MKKATRHAAAQAAPLARRQRRTARRRQQAGARAALAAAVGAGILLHGAPAQAVTVHEVSVTSLVAQPEPGGDSGTDSDTDPDPDPDPDSGGATGAALRDADARGSGQSGETAEDEAGNETEAGPGDSEDGDEEADGDASASTPTTEVRSTAGEATSATTSAPAEDASAPPSLAVPSIGQQAPTTARSTPSSSPVVPPVPVPLTVLGDRGAGSAGRVLSSSAEANAAHDAHALTPVLRDAALPDARPVEDVVRARSDRFVRALSENPVTRAALALVGLAPGGTPGGPAGPSSALLVAQWALFRRGGLTSAGGSTSLARTGQTGRATTASSAGAAPTLLRAAATPATQTAPAGPVVGYVAGRPTSGVTYSVSTKPRQGTVTVAKDGRYTYVPNAALAKTGGTDTFSITARVTKDRCAPRVTKKITVTVPAPTPTNRAPVATGVTTGAPDAAGVVTGRVGVTDPDGDALTYVVTTPAGKGSVTPGAGGTFTYRPSDAARHAAAATNAPASATQDTFVVTASDGRGGTVPVTVTVPVTGKNAAPVATSAVGTPGTDGSRTVTLAASDADRDPLTYTVVQPAKGTVIRNADGTFTYTPTAEAWHTASASTATDAERSDAFTVIVDDGHGGRTPVVVPITLAGGNRAPVPMVTVGAPGANHAVAITVAGGDPDGDPVSFEHSQPTLGTLSDHGNGSFTYTPTEQARHAAAATDAPPEAKLDTFVVVVDDGHGGRTPVTVLIPLDGENTAPDVTFTGPGTPRADGTVPVTITASDLDGDTPTYEIVQPARGTVVRNADGTFTYTPTAQARHEAAATNAPPEAKRDSFTIVVDDGHGGRIPVPVSVVVTPSNTAPVLAPPMYRSPEAGGSLPVVVGATDADRDAVTYEIVQPAQGTVVRRADGLFVYTANPGVRHALAADGTTYSDRLDSFTVIADDGHGGRTSVVVPILILPANSAPVLESVTTGTPGALGAVTVTVAAEDADEDVLTGTVTQEPSRGSVVRHADGTFTYTPTEAARRAAAAPGGVTEDSFTVTVSDGHGGTLEVPVTVTIAPLASVPTGTPGVVRTVGSPFEAAISPDGRYVYVTHPAQAGKVSVIDTTTNTVVKVIDVGAQPRNVAVSPDGRHVYVTNYADNTVSVIDATTNTMVRTIPVGSAPSAAAVSADNRYLYVAYGGGAGKVAVVDTTTDTVVATIPVGSTPTNMTRSGDRLYVTNQLGNTVSVIDTTTNTVVATLPSGIPGRTDLSDVVVSPDGRYVYAVDNSAAGGIVQYDRQLGTSRRLAVGNYPWSVALSPDGRYAYTTDYNSGTLLTTDTRTGQLVGSPIPVGRGPHGIVVGKDGRHAYVTNVQSGTVTVVALPTIAAPAEPDPEPVVNRAPTAGATTVGAVRTSSANLAGTVQAVDADGDTLTYTLTTRPQWGTVALDPRTGAYTYDNGLYADYGAYAVDYPEYLRDTFVVTADDGRGGTVPITVTVPGALLAAEVTQGSTDPATGTVSGGLGVTSLRGATLTYAVSTPPAGGTVTVADDGTYTYTPDPQIWTAALRSRNPPSDVFVVTATDADGSSVPVTVSVAPALNPSVPPGSYLTIARDVTITVTAESQRANQQWIPSQASYALADAPRDGIDNQDGRLVTDGYGGDYSVSRYVPAGSYQYSTRNIVVTVTASPTLPDGSVGAPQSVSYRAQDAGGIEDIAFVDGTLTVVPRDVVEQT